MSASDNIDALEMEKHSTNIYLKKLSPERWNDLVTLFETSAQCKECWCMNHRLPPKDEITGTKAKDALQDLTSKNKIYGVLAYSGDKCVGWCSVDPLKTQPGHDYCLESKDIDNKNIWSIHCIYLHPSFRGQGISKKLIQEAVEVAKSSGASQVLAFPIPEENKAKFSEHDDEFSGRFSTFIKLGFEKKNQLNDFYQVVSKNL